MTVHLTAGRVSVALPILPIDRQGGRVVPESRIPKSYRRVSQVFGNLADNLRTELSETLPLYVRTELLLIIIELQSGIPGWYPPINDTKANERSMHSTKLARVGKFRHALVELFDGLHWSIYDPLLWFDLGKLLDEGFKTTDLALEAYRFAAWIYPRHVPALLAIRVIEHRPLPERHNETRKDVGLGREDW